MLRKAIDALYIRLKSKPEVIVQEPVVLEKKQPVISSPVIEFIDTYRKNHRRFKVKTQTCYMSESKQALITDRVTGEKFGTWWYWDEGSRGMSKAFRMKTANLTWITDEELQFIFDEIAMTLGKRSIRLRELNESRVEAKHRNTRERLTKVYSQ